MDTEVTTPTRPISPRTRRLAVISVCIGVLLTSANATAVIVALRAINTDAGFSGAAVTWLVNSYLVPYGGFLLVVGRLADLFGHRRLFLLGIIAFTIASLGCGLSATVLPFIAGRVLQGMSGAVISTAALSLVTNLFTDSGERAKAVGFFGFAAGGGGVLGLLVGGVLATTLGWRWIFFLDVAVGVMICGLCLATLPPSPQGKLRPKLDFPGAVTLTAAMSLAVYSLEGINDTGWSSVKSLTSFACVALLLAMFVKLESRTPDPLMPRHIFQTPYFKLCCAVTLLAYAAWSASVLCVLYLQRVLGHSPLEAGLAFMPYQVIAATLSITVSARVVTRFSIKRPLVLGLLSAAIALGLLATAPTGGSVLFNVLPAVVILGVASSILFVPLITAAMREIVVEETGLASGILGTVSSVGYAVGLASLTGVADAETAGLRASGTEPLRALNQGYHVGFLLGAAFLVIAAISVGLLYEDTRDRRGRPSGAPIDILEN